ncbi:hypothetical protein BGZ76_000147 [Entomortierella beljakovae]|nr:hypothetical protein BGZ76_000147 [Entomortierella beljakovae]
MQIYGSGLSPPDSKKSYYEFASFRDLPPFLDVYTKIPIQYLCFFEQIREGHPRSEYYDIEWKLDSTSNQDVDPSSSEESASPSALNINAKQLEKQLFAKLLAANMHQNILWLRINVQGKKHSKVDDAVEILVSY